MPWVQVGNIQIYYEIRGGGEPLVLIGGLSNDVTDYTGKSEIAAGLARSFQVILFDNRGAGRTDKPDAPYSIEQMADDTLGLLDALRVEGTHVVGISMGGRIALQLALGHPERVKKLVLVSTSARGVKTWRRNFLVDVFSRISVFSGKYPQPRYAFIRQRQASSSYDCTSRLGELQIPTLILHGKQDNLAPYALAQEMHERIRGSQMLTFPGGHHFLFVRQKQFVDALVDFLGNGDHH